MNIINIQDNQKNGKIYNGKTNKFGITINDIDFIVKFSKDEEMSVYCEYVASNFIRKLGVPCHEVYLGNYKGTLVNVIRDFTSGTNITLHSFKDTKQSSEDTDMENKEYTYDDVIYLIDKHLRMSDKNKINAKKQFWNMFICDAIVGNRDRHWGNWGYIKRTNEGSEYEFAPLYDNGASLFPGVHKVIAKYIEPKTRKNFLHDRIFIFPASLLKIKRPDRTYRSNYMKMFSDLRVSRIFAQQVKLFRTNISYAKVFGIMQAICQDLPLELYYRRFYIEIVTLRYMCIVLRLDFEKSYKIIEEALKDYV